MMEKVALPAYLLIFLAYLYTLKGQEDFRSRKTSDFHMFKEMKRFSNFYLTGWTFMLHMIFVIIAILDETSKIVKLPVAIRKRFGRSRAFIFNTLLFPSCLLVSVVFWSIWHIDRELIFPKALDEFFPTWLNHMLHTFTLVPMVIELLLPKNHNFVQFRRAAPILVIYSITYASLLLSVYFRHGVWIYPIFKFLTWTQRLLLLISIMGLQLIFQKIGISIQNFKRSDRTAKIKL